MDNSNPDCGLEKAFFESPTPTCSSPRSYWTAPNDISVLIVVNFLVLKQMLYVNSIMLRETY